MRTSIATVSIGGTLAHKLEVIVSVGVERLGAVNIPTRFLAPTGLVRHQATQ